MSELSLLPNSPEILLVIADDELRTALADLLRVDGFATRHARAVDDVPARLAPPAPVAMIVDAALGRVEGADAVGVHSLLERLARAHFGVPTVLVSARSGFAERARAYGFGCVEIPFGRYALKSEIARVRRVVPRRPG
jgi:DNA-binding response OmpR family regulator